MVVRRSCLNSFQPVSVTKPFCDTVDPFQTHIIETNTEKVLCIPLLFLLNFYFLFFS